MMDDPFTSCLPPLLPLHGHDGDQTSWVLLDLLAYIADRVNSTSACSVLSNGLPIRVTLCTAPPPLVSHLCVWCPDDDKTTPSDIRRCSVEAADSDLVLLYVSLRSARFGPRDCFVYKAGNGAGKGPALWPLKLPSRDTYTHYDVALLPRRPHGGGGDFYVALLKYKSQNGAEHDSYELSVFHSTDGQWRRTPLPAVPRRRHYLHLTYKAIDLGRGGLVGFVDPWRGIIVCDVLGRRPARHLPLPAELVLDTYDEDMPLLHRDVALVDGRLTVVELRDVGRRDGDRNCQAWVASTWSREVTDDDSWEKEGWRRDYVVRSGDVSVNSNDDVDIELLHKVVDEEDDSGAAMRPTVEMPYIAQPTLSLSQSHVVYLVGKVAYLDRKLLVMAIDMKRRRLQALARFDAKRMVGVPFNYIYMHSRISKYFTQ